MRDLKDIIEAVKNDEHTNGEELYYAVCVLDKLLSDEVSARNNTADRISNLNEKQLRDRIVFRREKLNIHLDTAMNQPPKKWLGEAHDPKDPDYKAYLKIVRKVQRGEL